MKQDKKLDHWIQLYLQAKIEGNTKLMKIYSNIIIKLGGTVPRL